MADFFEPNEFYRRGGYVVNLLKHILHVLGLDEFLYVIRLRRRQLGHNVNSVAIFDSAHDPPTADFWWGIGLEQLKTTHQSSLDGE